MSYCISDFIKGQQDCRDGIPHKSGKGSSYDAGYSAQYELEQINDFRSKDHGYRSTQKTAINQ